MEPGELYFELDCTPEDAGLFYALVMFLWDRRTDPRARPASELDDAFNGDAARIITDLTKDIDDFGIEGQYDVATEKLTIMDIDRKPNLSVLPLLLVQLYPEKLPIAFELAMPGDPAKAVWTVVPAEGTITTDDWDKARAELEKPVHGGSDVGPATLH